MDFSKNDFISTINKPINFNNLTLFKLFDVYIFKKLMFLLTNLFHNNNNVLFVDIDTNYNYLPVSNNILFNRSFSKLYKIIKYFKVGLVFYINLKKKKFIFKKIYNSNVINVSLSDDFIKNKFDLGFNIKSPVGLYVFYLFVLNIYIKVNNKI